MGGMPPMGMPPMDGMGMPPMMGGMPGMGMPGMGMPPMGMPPMDGMGAPCGALPAGVDPMAFMAGMVGKGKGKGPAGKQPGWEYPEERPEPKSLKEAQEWKSKGWVDHTGKNYEEIYSTDPKIVMITLEGESAIVSQGFPAEAPSITCYNAKGHELFSQASNMLEAIVGDRTQMVKIVHDTEG